MAEKRRETPYLTNPPSFGDSGSIADPSDSADVASDPVVYDSDEEFSFAILAPDRTNSMPRITADELFSQGRILPLYPIFGGPTAAASGDEESAVSSSSSSSAAVAGEYCEWAPRSAPASPDRCKKSASTGSAMKWNFHELLGGRSHSDGKEKFVFLEKREAKVELKKESNRKKEEAKEMNMVTAHRLFYGKRGKGKGKNNGREEGKRKSYLPYQPQIVGFFGSLHGISQAHYPL